MQRIKGILTQEQEGDGFAIFWTGRYTIHLSRYGEVKAVVNVSRVPHEAIREAVEEIRCLTKCE